MIAELGYFTLTLALMAAAFQSVLPLVGAARGDQRLMEAGNMLALLQFGMLCISFGLLVALYINSDFSVLNVWQNSHTLKPMLYKITGTWGNHEGSMLLWVLILALFGAAVPAFGRQLPAGLKARVIAVQGWMGFAFILFVVATSNPFQRQWPAPLEGQDLNPVLQDIGLAVHPPLLYLGYVGFSMTFAFAIAALIEGRLDAAWARWVRPWALAAWVALTLGIAMGSYWAYYELGWGGWWFWDPVENASLMPWLSGTALLHSAIVVEKRNALRVWTVLLAIITFSLSLLGTFLVRSGVLTSVHSFASDPTRGVFILALLCIFVGGSLTLFAFRANSLSSGGLFAPISREGALVLNNLFLSAACGTVLIGTLYPLGYEALTGDKISVGPPFFNLTMVPLMIPLLLAMPFGPLMPWKRGDVAGVAQRLKFAGIAVILALIIGYSLQMGSMAPIGIALAAWLMVGAVEELISRAGFGRVAFSVGMKRLWGLPGSAWGVCLGHFGVGMMVFGIVAVTTGEMETVKEMREGETIEVAGYVMTLKGTEQLNGPNFTEARGVFSVMKDGRDLGEMRPAKRVYPARNMPTTEAAINSYGFSQLYVSLGDARPDERVLAVYAYYKPNILLIWLGTIVMGLGGMFSLFDRRLRIGVPASKREEKMKAQTA